ncbi:MAG: hypothetical protein ACRDBT_00190 [Aeromonas sp.]
MREEWQENHKQAAHSLALYSSTSLTDAFDTTITDASEFIEGKAFADWKKGREAELALQAGIADRLNGVIRACAAIVKTIGSIAGR